MSENIVGTLFDAKFDKHDFILNIRKFQTSLSEKDKIEEHVYRWTDDDQPPMYFVNASKYISIYQSITNNIDIMVNVPFETMSERLSEKVSDLITSFREEFQVEFWSTEDKKSNFFIVKNVMGDLHRTYFSVKQVVEDLDKARQLDIKRHELRHHLWRLRNGLSDISTSLLTFTDGYEKLEQTFNGSNRFLSHYFFLSSFDEETSSLICFIEEFLEQNFSDDWEGETNDKNKPIIELCLTGFEKSKDALQDICNLCINYHPLEEELLNFALEDGYNPFKIYGVVIFADKFNTMYQVFQEELNKIQ